MYKGIMVLRSLTGILGITLVVLGVFFWFGNLLQLVPLHMWLGVAFVLALWTLAILSWAAGGPRPLAAVALLWGAVIPALGFAQYQLLPGGNHWVVRVLHLAVGIVGMALAGILSKSVPHQMESKTVAATSIASGGS